MIPAPWFEQARQRIQPYIRQTPLTYDAAQELYFKWENQQVTGSFKVRGALNKTLSLEEWERQRGLVTASAGNHGQGLALAGQITRSPVIVFASEHAVAEKIFAIRNLGADVRLVPGGYGQAEQAGLAYAKQVNVTWVSPYNDGQVIAGQGTLAAEIAAQMPLADQVTWVVPAGGGGLISGIGAYWHLQLSRPRLVAVQSEASPFLHDLYHTGSQQNTVELPSLADGLAGPVENGSVTIPLVHRLVDEFVLVSEAQIRQAIAFAWRQYQQRIEASAAVALAAVLYGQVPQRPALILITGGNIQPELHTQILSET